MRDLGPRPILLHLTPTEHSGLTQLLKAFWRVEARDAGGEVRLQTGIAGGLLGGDLENVPAEKSARRTWETLASWVRAGSAGLMITGGRQSYGPGGYYKSPLEPIMPVSMELRQEQHQTGDGDCA